jgi:hypothetical protein
MHVFLNSDFKDLGHTISDGGVRIHRITLTVHVQDLKRTIPISFQWVLYRESGEVEGRKGQGKHPRLFSNLRNCVD